MAYTGTVLDTARSTLVLYVGIHKHEFKDIMVNRAVLPCKMMNKTNQRSWVALCATKEAALKRACLGFIELGYAPDKSQMLLLTFEFTALSVGHFTLTGMQKIRLCAENKVPPSCAES